MCLPGIVEAVRSAYEHDATPRRIGRRRLLAGSAAAAVASLSAPSAASAAPAVGSARLADLTHTFTTTFPVGVSTPAERRIEFSIEHDGFYAQRWSFWEHTATHVDAPGHFVPGARQGIRTRGWK